MTVECRVDIGLEAVAVSWRSGRRAVTERVALIATADSGTDSAAPAPLASALETALARALPKRRWTTPHVRVALADPYLRMAVMRFPALPAKAADRRLVVEQRFRRDHRLDLKTTVVASAVEPMTDGQHSVLVCSMGRALHDALHASFSALKLHADIIAPEFLGALPAARAAQGGRPAVFVSLRLDYATLVILGPTGAILHLATLRADGAGEPLAEKVKARVHRYAAQASGEGPSPRVLVGASDDGRAHLAGLGDLPFEVVDLPSPDAPGRVLSCTSKDRTSIEGAPNVATKDASSSARDRGGRVELATADPSEHPGCPEGKADVLGGSPRPCGEGLGVGGGHGQSGSLAKLRADETGGKRRGFSRRFPPPLTPPSLNFGRDLRPPARALAAGLGGLALAVLGAAMIFVSDARSREEAASLSEARAARLAADITTLEASTASDAPDLAAFSRLRDRIAALGALDFKASPTVGALLSALESLVPGPALLTSLNYDRSKQEVEVVAVAPDGADLTKLFELLHRHEGFRDVRLVEKKHTGASAGARMQQVHLFLNVGARDAAPERKAP